MKLIEGLEEICKLASPEVLTEQNIECIFITAIDMEGHGISRVSGHFVDIMAMLDFMIDHIVEHSNKTLTRKDIIDYLQSYTGKEE